MKRYILIFMFILPLYILSHNITDSTKIITPEGVGRYLLINRGDLQKTPVAIDIDRLLP